MPPRYDPARVPVLSDDGPFNMWTEDAGLAATSILQLPAAAAGDLARDSSPDVVVGSLDNLVLYFNTATLNTGNEEWVEIERANPFRGLSFNWGVYPRLWDVDADSDLDVVVSSELGAEMYLLENVGTATGPQFAFAPSTFDGAVDALKGRESLTFAIGKVQGLLRPSRGCFTVTSTRSG